MRSKNRWMSNAIHHDDDVGVFPAYSKINTLGLSIYQKTVLNTQQTRSQALSEIEKLDLWDRRNYFRNTIEAIIMKHNMMTTDI